VAARIRRASQSCPRKHKSRSADGEAVALHIVLQRYAITFSKLVKMGSLTFQ